MLIWTWGAHRKLLKFCQTLTNAMSSWLPSKSLWTPWAAWLSVLRSRNGKDWTLTWRYIASWLVKRDPYHGLIYSLYIYKLPKERPCTLAVCSAPIWKFLHIPQTWNLLGGREKHPKDISQNETLPHMCQGRSTPHLGDKRIPTLNDGNLETTGKKKPTEEGSRVYPLPFENNGSWSTPAQMGQNIFQQSLKPPQGGPLPSL